MACVHAVSILRRRTGWHLKATFFSGSTSAVIIIITGIEGEVVSLRSTVCVSNSPIKINK